MTEQEKRLHRCCFTGHRPEKLFLVDREIIKELEREIKAAIERGYTTFISGMATLIKVENLASTLQVCLDSGAKKVLLPITAAADLSTVPSELIGCFNIIFYQSPEDAVFKALGVE